MTRQEKKKEIKKLGHIDIVILKNEIEQTILRLHRLVKFGNYSPQLINLKQEELKNEIELLDIIKEVLKEHKEKFGY